MADGEFYCGLDFGTSRSGYAYAAIGDELVKVKQGWAGEPPNLPYPKTLTALLYKKQTWQVVAWGWEALHRFQSMDKADQPKYQYLTNFKLALAEDKKYTLPPGLGAVRCIADYLRCIVLDYDELMGSVYGERYSRDKVQFVMTVPAGWSDRAKTMTREAAVEAGLVPPGQAASRLRFLHEPEAAMLAVLNSSAQSLDEKLDQGHKVMIIDAGGGTIDITMHRVAREGAELRLHEVTKREMETKGSTFIDERFDKHVMKVLGAEVFNAWATKQPGEKLKLWSNWEMRKQRHIGLGGSREVEVPMPVTLQKSLPKLARDKLADAQDGEDAMIVLKTPLMNSLFDESVSATIEAASRMMAVSVNPDFIFVVGGFGSSPYLVSRVKDAFKDKVSPDHIVSPEKAARAIMEGAVYEAQRPSTLASRVARFTYGLQISLPLEKWLDRCQIVEPPAKATIKLVGGTKVCEDCFLKLVSAGDPVAKDEAKRVTVAPASDGDQMAINIYCSEEKDPHFICKPGVRKVGELLLKGLKAQGSSPYQVEVSMLMGEATLRAIARDLQQNTRVETEIRVAD